MHLGKCIDLTELTPNTIEGGGATVTWTAISPTHGTCVIHFPPGRDCPGGDPGAEIFSYGQCSFLFKGCGQIHVMASGTSGMVSGSPAAFSQLLLADGVTLSAQPSISMAGVTGGTSCEGIALEGDGDMIVSVRCGMELTLSFDAFGTYNFPESAVTFDVEVYS